MAEPSDAERLFREAMDFHRRGMLAEALVRIDQAAAQMPGHAAIWNNRGTILKDMGRAVDALESFSRAIALKPGSGSARYNRANLLIDLGQAEQALADYDAAISADAGFATGFAEVWCNRGNALARLERSGQALDSYDRALSLKPDFVEAMRARGHLLFAMARMEEGLEQFRRAAGADLAASGSVPSARDPAALAAWRRHEEEQAAYRQRRPVAEPSGLGDRVDSAAVTPGNAQVARDWQDKNPQIAVVDGFLTPAALSQLRRYALEAPVWHSAHDKGYLGAFPENGFAAPLLGQIAQEMCAAWPEIFRGHPLRYLWAFKYDGSLPGTAIHADEAAVNVNFWITPDEANLDPATGGLVVWDKAAPLDWDFAKFNGDVGAIREFLAGAGAKALTVPYRANRAVIFDSDLFHETDAIRFRPGYENRRINVTMLFGQRDKS